MTNLTDRSLTAIFWGSGGAVLRILLQFITQVSLARVLGPDQFGLFALGAIVVGFSNFFADVGIAYGLIQKKNITDNDARFVSTWQVLIGAFVTASIILFSKNISEFFGDDEVREIVAALAVLCLINAAAAPSLNLLKRQLDFKRIQLTQLIAYFVGYCLIGLPLALSGFKVWALVIAWLTQSTLVLVLLYGYVRHRIKPLFWYQDAISIFKYGATVFATNIVNWLISNIDRVIIGRIFSSQEIGFYATSYNMLYNPTSSILGTLQPVFFSASAQSKNGATSVLDAYKSLVGCTALFILPIFAGIAAVPETFVLAIYGPAWAQLADILCPLALAMPIFLAWGITTPVLWTAGKAASEFKTQLPIALIWAATCFCAAQHSLTAVAWAVFILFLLRYLWVLHVTMSLLKLQKSALWNSIRGGLALSVLSTGFLKSIDYLLHIAAVSPIITLSIEILSTAAFIVILIKFIPILVGPDVASLIRKIAGRSHPRIAKILHIFPICSI